MTEPCSFVDVEKQGLGAVDLNVAGQQDSVELSKRDSHMKKKSNDRIA